MNSATGLAIAFGGTLVCLAIGAMVWWLNRTPASYRRRPDPNLPLFSVGLSEMRRRTPAENAAAAARGDVLLSPRGRPAETATASSMTAASATAVSASAVADSPRTAPHEADRPIHVTTLTTAAPSPSPYAPRDGSRQSVPSSFTTPSNGSPSNGSPSNGSPSNGTAATPTATPAATPLPPDQPISANGVPGTQVEGHLLRFTVPQEGTLQFLPGRLEIASGPDHGREIRFVRVPGPHGTEVTFGRSEGPAYRHVQLREGTVSRAHARLRLLEGQWHLCNLSVTNPVVYNGRILTDGEEQELSDGDRIEMGEVVFGFRSR